MLLVVSCLVPTLVLNSPLALRPRSVARTRLQEVDPSYGRDPRSAPPWLATNTTMLEGLAAMSTPSRRASSIEPIVDLCDFERALASAGDRLVVIKFYSRKCRACLAIEPQFARLAKAGLAADFYEVDHAASRPLDELAGIRKLPAAHIYRDGELVCTHGLGRKHFEAFREGLLHDAGFDRA